MDLLFSTGLHNAAVATLLALLVWGFTRICRKPPVAHLLWLLVLVKLVTPPVVNFHLWNWSPGSAETANEQTAELSYRAPQPVTEGSYLSIPQSPEVVRSGGERSQIPDDRQNSVARVDLPPVSIPHSGRPGFSIAATWTAVRPALMGIWIAGVGLVALLAGMRIVRFQRLLAGTLPAEQRYQSVADDLATRLGLRCSPDVRMAASAIAPLVWCLGARAMVVIPRSLLAALDEQQTAMVLAHELAHLRRRDHWVRVIELAVSVLYWWNPLVWWIRRQLRTAEEQCCDAWVAWAYPDRSHDYAQSLLKSAELLSSQLPLAGLASPFLNAQTLKSRIEMVLMNRSQRTASRSAALGLALLAAAVIPVGVWGVAEEQGPGDQGRAVATSVNEETQTVTALVAGLKEREKKPANDAANTEAARIHSAINENPLANELLPFQGTWNFGACESELWEAELDEIQKKWTWRIQGQTITWIRWGKGIDKLTFTVDPSKTPNQIDFTFLDGPDKGKTCQGIYKFERESLWVCLTEPDAKVARPTRMAFSGGAKTSMLLLHKKRAAKTESTTADSPPVPSTAPVPPPQNAAAAKPAAAKHPLLEGTFNFEKLESEKWPAAPEDFQRWQWTIRGEEITWTRPGHDAVKLSFTIDPSASPRHIDLTFLTGPDKGEKCQGIYFLSRHEIVICFHDPGANVGRPTNAVSKPGSRHTLITLVPARILPVAEEVQALQGVWKFDIYYSDWWPERISNPPISWSKWRWTVTGNEIHWTGMKVDDVKLSFTVDPTQSPRHIDFTFLDGPHKGKILRGMYKFYAEDACYICFADPEAKFDRPTDVSYSTNSGRTMVSIEKAAPETPAAQTKGEGRGAEIDAAIARLRQLGAFVREFHPRGAPQYWVQIISTGLGASTRESSLNFGNAAMEDVEIIGRGVAVQLHLRRTSVTSAGLERLASAGKIELLELTGPNVDNAMLKILPKLPLQGQLGLSSDLLTNTGIESVAECRQLTGISLDGNLLTNACLEQLTGLPKLQEVSLGKNFTRAAFEILSRLEGLTGLDVSEVTPDLGDLKKVPKLRRLSLSGKAYDDETARTIADTFQSLEEAYLRRTSITNAGVEHLSRIRTLKILTLDDSLIDDGVAASIRKMKQLKWLSVGDCAVGDDTLAALSECPEMWYVFLVHTPVTDDGIAHLVKLKKPLALYLANCKSVTDASVKSLSQLPDSENLHINLQDSGITEKGARQLQAALPHAQIRWGIPPLQLKK